MRELLASAADRLAGAGGARDPSSRGQVLGVDDAHEPQFGPQGEPYVRSAGERGARPFRSVPPDADDARAGRVAAAKGGRRDGDRTTATAHEPDADVPGDKPAGPSRVRRANDHEIGTQLGGKLDQPIDPGVASHSLPSRAHGRGPAEHILASLARHLDPPWKDAGEHEAAPGRREHVGEGQGVLGATAPVPPDKDALQHRV